MLYNFNTDDLKRAKAALLLYAIYKSKGKDSPLSGTAKWDRMESFCKGACCASSTTAEFVTKFKEAAKVGAIKPYYLTDVQNGENFVPMPDGSIVSGDIFRNFQTHIFEDNEIRKIIEKEYAYIVTLVNERDYREKIAGGYIYEENEN